MLKKTLKELSSHTFIYSLTLVSSIISSILLLPVYTRFLSKSDYGILELLDYTNTIFTIVVIAGLSSAIPRFYNENSKQEDKKKVISTAFIFVLLTGAFLCFIAFLFNDSLSILILGDLKYKKYINLNILLLFSSLILLVSGTGFIAAKKSKTYLIYNLIKLVIAIAGNLYFIVVLKLGVSGMLYGNILAASLVCLIITGHNIYLNGIKVDYSILLKLLKFGIPLIPATLAATIMHNADRFLIRYFCTLDDVGIYSIGYKFPFMLNALIMHSFSLVWSGSVMYEVSKKDDSAYQFGKITTYVIGLFLFAQLTLSVFSVSLITILTDPKFLMAYKIIPLVSLGLCFHAFYFFFSVGTFLQKKTWLVNIAYLPAAAINIIGNIYLLPKYGYIAAAWMTLLTYFSFFLILYFTCRKLIHVKYETKRLFMLFIVGIIIYLCSSYLIFSNLFLEILKGLFFILLFLSILFFTGWLTKSEKLFLKDKFIKN
jgi:O-antigen/teichoic acid export membrane protein